MITRQKTAGQAPTLLRRVGILGAVAVMFAFTWLFGMFSFGRSTEDLCLDDLTVASGYGSTTMSVQGWPPSLDCELGGRDVPDLVVHHRVLGVLWAGWRFVAPISMFVVFVALAVALRAVPPLPVQSLTLG